jgi:hypothetical protein
MPIYLGTFLIALTTLALEITLTRLLSVITWYHLAFFAVATAMLGMTAGAVTVYLKQDWFSAEKRPINVAKAALGYAIFTPITLIILCFTPIVFDLSLNGLLMLLIATTACSLPFYFSGIVITVALTQYPLPIGKIYASDLIGASLGCLLVLGGLNILDAPSLILLCAAIGGLSAFSFAGQHSLRYWAIGIVMLLSAATLFNATTGTLYPFVVKGKMEHNQNIYLDQWNSFSRIVVFNRLNEAPKLLWGPSPVAPQKILPIHYMTIDGEAATGVQRFSSLEEIDHLRFDITNLAYYLRPHGGACIIGVGGGKDLQSALAFGHEKVIGVDVNPIFIDLLENEFREFAGLAAHDAVTFVVDEARSYLSSTSDHYAVIQMSLIDTWAATGAGAFTLSENALYTVEAWQTFFKRLTDNGIFTVSRWYDADNLGETGRLVSLAVASLLESGISQPADHLAMFAIGNLSTLLVSKQPFNYQELEQLKQIQTDLAYQLIFMPKQPPEHETLKNILAVSSFKALDNVIADQALNYTPPTDENPYFFNMLKWQTLYPALQLQAGANAGVIGGNLHATLTLISLIICLLLLTLLTIIIPLLIKTRFQHRHLEQPILISALYFSLIGAGFMFVEIALIQRLSVFLGHPTYALGILLFTLIASTGIGSLFSERLPLTRLPGLILFPLALIIALFLTQAYLPPLISEHITRPMLHKIILSIIVLFPLGILMGFFFPTGMKLVKAINDSQTPWYWALNGIFGVLCSALAVFISIYFGISTNFYIALFCYSGVLLCLYGLYINKAAKC